MTSFAKPIATAIKDHVYVGIEPSLAAVFNRDIGYADVEDVAGEPLIGPRARSGFLVIAGRRGDYMCAYIAPLYVLLNRTSNVLLRLQALFGVMLDILGVEAFYRIERNKHHSRLRHTMGVEIQQFLRVYDGVLAERSVLLDGFRGDVNRLNIDLSRINSLIHGLTEDAAKQFATEFDVFGNKQTAESNSPNGVILKADVLANLIKTIANAAARRRAATHLLLSLDHEQSVQIASESALRISLTELLNNAVKYNIAEDRIRVRTRDRAGEVQMTISNLGPQLSSQEADLVPLMGLRGVRSQRHVSDGSGQGLATVFNILEDIGVDVEYRQRPLSREQLSHLTARLGSKRVAELSLTSHTIELVLPINKRDGGPST